MSKKKNTKEHIQHIYNKYGKYINTYWDDFNDPNDDNNYYTIGQIIDLARNGGSGGGLAISNFNNLSNGWSVSDGVNTFTHIDTGGSTATPTLQQVLDSGNSASGKNIMLENGGLWMGADSGNKEFLSSANDVSMRNALIYTEWTPNSLDFGHFDTANQGAKVVDMNFDSANKQITIKGNYNYNMIIDSGSIRIDSTATKHTLMSLYESNLTFFNDEGLDQLVLDKSGIVVNADESEKTAVIQNGELNLGDTALANWKNTLGISDTPPSGNDTSIWTGHTNIDITAIGIGFGDIASIKGVGYDSTSGARLRVGDRVVANNGTFFVDAVSEGTNTYILHSVSGVSKNANNGLIQDNILGQLFVEKNIQVGWGNYLQDTSANDVGMTFNMTTSYLINLVGNWNKLSTDGSNCFMCISGSNDLILVKYDGTNYVGIVILRIRS